MLSNDDALWLGRHPALAGRRALAARVELHATALGRDDARALHAATRSDFERRDAILPNR